jgi:WD40 repeat protein/tRNA A-37 threonylcarbamoyl transferase component Bud32
MKQCPDRDQLELLLGNGLVETARDELELHVEDCALCQQALETLTDATVCGLEPGPDVMKFVAGAGPGLLIDPLQATAVATAAANERVGRAAPMVAGYEIEGELGRGGMGVVYKARHVRLNRSCALKMILAGAHASPEDAARFVTEAEAIARLAHSHIVQIRHIGEADGLPYFELEYLAGGSLDRQLDGTPWPATRAARLAEQVALGIAEAHRQGIVHRDLKPSNVLLAAEGTPKVGDFGLAKMLDSTSALTQSESVMGSPSYMAPEQAQGRAKNAGPAVDVYAVGAILYELLTGRPPFRGTTALETLEQVKTIEPVRPSRLVPGLPRDIETICLKCLQKEPGKRYASALALGEDLRRFLDGRPILARRSTSTERFWRWCRRNPGLAAANTAAAALVALLFLGTAVAAWTFRNQRDQIRRADHKTREGLFESLTAQARATRFSRQVGQRFDSLEALDRAARIARELKLPPKRLDPLRDQAIACLALPDMRKSGRVIHRPPGVESVAFDSTMTRYALRLKDGTIQVKNVDDDQEVAHFQARGDRAFSVFGFSPDGRYLATTHYPGFALTVWDIDRGTVAVSDPGSVQRATFSPDSRRIACGHHDGELLIHDLATGQTSRRWPEPATLDFLAFRPYGAQIAVVDNERKNPTCRIRDSETGRLVRSIPLPTIGSVAWSPDGTTLATPCHESKIYLWEADTGKQRAVLEGSTNGGLIAAFHPSGTLVASNGWEGRLRLWDVVLGRPVLSLTGSSVSAFEFSQDGRIVVAFEDELTTYQVDPALEYRTFAHVSSEPMHYECASIRGDGRLLAVGTDRGVVLWDLASGRELGFLPIGLARHLMFEASGDLLTSGSIGVRRWPVQLDSDRGEFRIGPPRQLPFPSNDAGIAEDRLGRIVALANFGATHVLTPDRKFEVGPLDDVRSVAVSPDGKWLATGSHGHNGAQVWRISDAARVADLRIEGLVEVAFSPDGKWLMTSPSPCRLWAVGTWSEARQKIGGQGLCFSPDGRLLAVMDARRVIHLVETESGRMVARLESPDSCGIVCATFSPDGSRLVVTTNEVPAAVHVWDLRAIRKRLAAMGLDWDAPAYSDDDPAAASVPPLPPLQVDLGPLAGEIEHHTESPETLIERYTARLKNNPDDAEAYLHRGHALSQLRRIPEAIDDFTEVVPILVEK